MLNRLLVVVVRLRSLASNNKKKNKNTPSLLLQVVSAKNDFSDQEKWNGNGNDKCEKRG
jgi:hypothetical protein